MTTDNPTETARERTYKDARNVIMLFGVALLVGTWYVGTLALAEFVPPIEIPVGSVTVPPIAVAGFLLANVALLIVLTENKEESDR